MMKVNLKEMFAVVFYRLSSLVESPHFLIKHSNYREFAFMKLCERNGVMLVSELWYIITACVKEHVKPREEKI